MRLQEYGLMDLIKVQMMQPEISLLDLRTNK